MNVWYFIEKGYLTELFMSDLDEITEVFNGYELYVPINLLSSFELEATQLQKSYQLEKAITESKAREAYSSAQSSGVNLTVEMTPEFIIDSLKEETKIKIINLRITMAIINYIENPSYIEFYNNYINAYKQETDSLQFYYVDLDSALNKKYFSDELNITDDFSKLKLKLHTLQSPLKKLRLLYCKVMLIQEPLMLLRII